MCTARAYLAAALCMALIGIVFIAIALGTDNWICFKVDTSAAAGNQQRIVNEIYFTRSYGFFRECFNGDPKPAGEINYKDVVAEAGSTISLYKSPHNTKCVNAYPGFNYKNKDQMNRKTKEYIGLKIAYITLYSIGLFLAVLSLLFMAVSIGIKKSNPVMFTGFSFLLAAILLAIAVGIWQKSNDTLSDITNFRKDGQKGGGDEYDGRNWYSKDLWPEVVRLNTSSKYCWSYILFWVGLILLFLTALTTCCCVIGVRKERLNTRKKKTEYKHTKNGAAGSWGMTQAGAGQAHEQKHTKGGGTGSWGMTQAGTGQGHEHKHTKGGGTDNWGMQPVGAGYSNGHKHTQGAGSDSWGMTPVGAGYSNGHKHTQAAGFDSWGMTPVGAGYNQQVYPYGVGVSATEGVVASVSAGQDPAYGHYYGHQQAYQQMSPYDPAAPYYYHPAGTMPMR